MRPSELALKRLRNIKSRHLRKAKNVAEVVETMWGYWQKQHRKGEPTTDLNLLQSTACPTRYEHKGVYKCAKYAPRTVKRLETLKICEICLSKTEEKPSVPEVQSSVVEVKNVVGGHTTVSMQALKEHYENLMNGSVKLHCRILKGSSALFELPCMKGVQDPKNPDLTIGCRYPDCEKRKKDLVRRIYFGKV